MIRYLKYSGGCLLLQPVKVELFRSEHLTNQLRKDKRHQPFIASGLSPEQFYDADFSFLYNYIRLFICQLCCFLSKLSFYHI